jgi:hypothetical protein
MAYDYNNPIERAEERSKVEKGEAEYAAPCSWRYHKLQRL